MWKVIRIKRRNNSIPHFRKRIKLKYLETRKTRYIYRQLDWMCFWIGHKKACKKITFRVFHLIRDLLNFPRSSVILLFNFSTFIAFFYFSVVFFILKVCHIFYCLLWCCLGKCGFFHIGVKMIIVTGITTIQIWRRQK